MKLGDKSERRALRPASAPWRSPGQHPSDDINFEQCTTIKKNDSKAILMVNLTILSLYGMPRHRQLGVTGNYY